MSTVDSGDNSTTQSLVPVQVDTSGVLSGKTITAIAAGYVHTVALDSDGKLYAWGDNYHGKLGVGDSSTINSNVPVEVDASGVLSGKTITAIAAVAGSSHTLALDSDGKVYGWGDNHYGQLGDGSSGYLNFSYVPVTVVTSGVLSGKTITAIAAGGDHTLALDSDMKVYAWGNDSQGQLGNGFDSDSEVPVEVRGLQSVGDLILPISDVPTEFALEANYPNPFNPTTSINYQLLTDSKVELSVFDMNGKKITTLVNEAKSTGYYSVTWDASNVSSGIDFYRLQAGDFIDTKKMVYMK
ncbi:MAG: T9SS type A sorting domain-containing protein [Candidatus Marinimicrobia bacterium]|nr:T9SS type A sorting domain-containing protein [Candidatus Neomarinimicrobiota bacterium]